MRCFPLFLLPYKRTPLNLRYAQHKETVRVEAIKREIKNTKDTCRNEIQQILDQYYPGNSPADWYVLAVGDGDGMRDWLKGKPLERYGDYMPEKSPHLNNLPEAIKNAFGDIKELQKRMGPSTHNALSRALLDFSNQLVPYLTERRYAGRLIYSRR